MTFIFNMIRPLINFVWPLIKKFIKLNSENQNWHNDENAEKRAKKISSYETKSKILHGVSKENIKFSSPVIRKTRITSKFGWRILNFDGKKRKNFHTGADFGGQGQVVACEDVIIKKILKPDKKYPCRFKWTGKTWKSIAPKGRAWTPYLICVGKISKVKYKYKHVKSVVVVGDTVRRGQTLGIADNLGFSMGAHLHFEIWPYKKGKWPSPVDPVKFLKKKGVKI